MFKARNTQYLSDKRINQKGAVSVEYVVIISFLIGLSLVVILKLVDPTSGADDSVLPSSYNAVSQKVGKFGTLPE